MHCVFYFAVMIFTNELKAQMEILQKILAWDKKKTDGLNSKISRFDSRWRLHRNRNTAAQNGSSTQINVSNTKSTETREPVPDSSSAIHCT